jgi:hypothetical protein
MDRTFKDILESLKKTNEGVVKARYSVVTNKPLKPRSLTTASNSLPKSPPGQRSKNPAILFNSLNKDVMGHIKEQLKELYNSKYNLEEYVLIDGIPEDKIRGFIARLLQNENALYYLTETIGYTGNKDLDYHWLSSNTNPVAIELIKEALKKNPDTFIYWAQLAENPKAADILLDKNYRDKIELVFDNLSKNTNSKVIKFLAKPENYNKIIWKNLSANESVGAVALLEKEIAEGRPENVYRQEVSTNSKAIRILEEYPDKRVGDSLSANNSDKAIELLKEHIKEKPKDINFFSLSINPNQKALEFLQEINKIKWWSLSSNTNPNAIKLLEDRFEVEKGLIKNSLTVYQNISQFDKINWFRLSKNPSAIKLIIARIKYENSLLPEIIGLLKDNEKISYSELAANPSIFAKKKLVKPIALSPIVESRASPPRAAAQASSRIPRSSRVSPIPRSPRVSPTPRSSRVSRAFRIAPNSPRAALHRASHTALHAVSRAPRTTRTAPRSSRTSTLTSTRAAHRATSRAHIRTPLHAVRRTSR